MKNSQGIEGVPVGVKVVAVRNPEQGEHYINYGGEIRKAEMTDHYGCMAIVAPDNVYKTLDLSSLPVPEGYQHKGDTWFRVPCDEYFLNTCGCFVNEPKTGVRSPDKRRIILESVSKKRRVLIVECALEDGVEVVGLVASVKCPHSEGISIPFRIEWRD